MCQWLTLTRAWASDGLIFNFLNILIIYYVHIRWYRNIYINLGSKLFAFLLYLLSTLVEHDLIIACAATPVMQSHI